MSKLGQVVESVEKYNQFVLTEVKSARSDKEFGQQMVNRWNKVKAQIANIGFEAFSSTPEQLGEFVKAQLANVVEQRRDHGLPVGPERKVDGVLGLAGSVDGQRRHSAA